MRHPRQPFSTLLRIFPPAGERLTGIHNPTLKRQCLANHVPLDYTRDQFIDAWKKRLGYPELKLILREMKAELG